jgi:hypothetical protein
MKCIDCGVYEIGGAFCGPCREKELAKWGLNRKVTMRCLKCGTVCGEYYTIDGVPACKDCFSEYEAVKFAKDAARRSAMSGRSQLGDSLQGMQQAGIQGMPQQGGLGGPQAAAQAMNDIFGSGYVPTYTTSNYQYVTASVLPGFADIVNYLKNQRIQESTEPQEVVDDTCGRRKIEV